MNTVLLHIRFPYAGPWAGDMAGAFGSLADDIAAEEGLLWKLWLEDATHGQAGGAYLFRDRGCAERYLGKHRARLAQWGISDLEIALSDVNDALSRRTWAGAREALPERAAASA